MLAKLLELEQNDASGVELGAYAMNAHLAGCGAANPSMTRPAGGHARRAKRPFLSPHPTIG
jgi:hypothetical protein